MTQVMQARCTWVGADFLMRKYHDFEWGVPVHTDTMLFEFIVLEGAQAGLSWATVLRKREHYRTVFDGFDVKKISLYNPQRIALLLADSGIIRNRLKIVATIQNAKAFLAIQKEFGSFDTYIWRFVNNKPIRHSFQSLQEYPTKIREAEVMSHDLIKRGFKFVGPTICYAFMQAVGMVNDHQVSCFRHSNV